MSYNNRVNEWIHIPRANEMSQAIRSEIAESMFLIQQGDGQETARIKEEIIATLKEARGRELLAYYEVYIKFDFARHPEYYKF